MSKPCLNYLRSNKVPEWQWALCLGIKWLKISREDQSYASIGSKGNKIKGLKVGCKMQ